MSIIKIDKEDLRDIIREAVKKKLGSLKETAEAKTPVKRPKLTEAQRIAQVQNALKMLQEAVGHTPAGSRLGPKISSSKVLDIGDEAIAGGVPGPMAGATKMEGAQPSKVNEREAEELEIWMVTSSREIYERSKPIMKNLALKMKKGNYDSELAPKLWSHLVDLAAKMYAKEYATEDEAPKLFNKATRMAVAKNLARRFEQKVRIEGNPLDRPENKL